MDLRRTSRRYLRDSVRPVRSRVTAVAAAVGGALAVAATLVLRDDQLGPWDLLWISLQLLCAMAVLTLLVGAVRQERLDRRRAAVIAATSPADVADRAVEEERARLAVDTEAVIRAAVTRMRVLAREARDEEAGARLALLRDVQQEGHRAMGDLRRMLGLLRGAEHDDVSVVPKLPGQAAVRPVDVAFAATLVVLAVGERSLYGELADVGPAGATSAVSLVLTALTAGAVVLRRAAPGIGATVAAVNFLTGAVMGTPVTGGIWMIGTLGSLAWAASAAGRRNALGVLALIAAVVVAQRWRYPSNLEVTVLIVVVPALAGAVVGWRRALGAAARDRAARRSAELAAVREDALRRERRAVARELHDVVSHAVGVVVVQAGAAEALHGIDPQRSSEALDVVERVASDALTELDRLVGVLNAGAVGRSPGVPGAVARGPEDLRVLLDRMRSAGLRVDLSGEQLLGGEHAEVAYRVVQEALTNVLRHAPGAAVRVTISTNEQGLVVQVQDDGPGPQSDSIPGYGLVGIAERTHRLGGELVSGPGAGGRGFGVTARLPRSGCRRASVET